MFNTERIIIISGILGLLLLVLFIYRFSSGNSNPQNLTIGERFHKETSLSWKKALSDIFQTLPKSPPLYKEYKDAKVIRLPKVWEEHLSLEQALIKRRSIRNYSSKPMDLEKLSQLLFAASGITGSLYDRPLRTAPSAGALYPIEIYLVVNRVKELPPGLYHYRVFDHSLELLREEDLKDEVTKAGLRQDMLREASVVFILSAIFDRVRSKYGERGYRYAYMEAGHISQNIYLQATSLNLGSVCVGAFLDEEANRLIGVDGVKEAVLYMHAVGTL
jgi:SagB-type dehydrogenase family enzyme